jgi:hypothetical protein
VLKMVERSLETSEPRSDEPMDGLADRMWWRVWR